MRRKLAGYTLLSVYAFGFFSVVFHTVAHAQTTTEPISPLANTHDMPQVLAAQTQREILPAETQTTLPTPTVYISNFEQPKTLPNISPTSTPASSKTATTPTPTPKSQDTILPAKTQITPPIAAAQSTPTSSAPVANTGGLDAEKLFTMSNDYRAARGLPALQKEERTCSLAASRAPEISGEVAAGTLHAGLQSRALPYWNTENIIAMNSEEAAFNWWVNDPIHHQAIVGNFTYSCVACSGNSCAQEFTNFQAK